MKKIDLHLHTQKCKNGDGVGREIEPICFIEEMHKNNIGICAITNHNKFDDEEYELISKADKNFIIFPSIELDVKFGNKIKHIILVCNPNCSDVFKEVFSQDDSRNYEEYKLEYTELISCVKRFKVDDILIIPHFLDKDKERSINIEEKNRLKADLSGYTIILEPKLKTMGIINAHNEISLIGSDVKEWSNYSQVAKMLPEIKFNVDSFSKFYELATEPKVFINSFIKECEKIELILPNSNGLHIYKDVNVIFGGKGAGKTILLKDYVYPKLMECGEKVFFHEGKDYEKVYLDILERSKCGVDVDIDLKEDIIKGLNDLLNYKKKSPSDFINKYINYHRSQDISKNAKKIKKSDCIYDKNNTDSIDEIVETYIKHKDAISKVDKINLKYRDYNDESRETLTYELESLRKDVYEKSLLRAKDIFGVSKTSIILDNLKEIVDKKTGKKSKPTNIGFYKMVFESRSLYEKVNTVKQGFKKLKISKKIKIGVLPDKGEVFSNVEINVLDENEKYIKGSPFDRNNISINRKFIKKIMNFSYKDLLKINALFSPEESKLKGIDYFGELVKKSCKVIRSNDETYEPSEGEKSILSISGLLEDLSYDCYIFDEVERGLGNKYISEYIIPKIKLLRDMGKTVILSTHNANIAINTLPTQTIFCNYLGDSSKDIYYAGNMYSNELISIKNSQNLISWENEAIKHLEGSADMFKVRRNIWKQN